MKKRDWLTSLGILGACALCCTLPLLGGAATVTISSLFLKPVAVSVLALTFLIAVSVIYQRRKAKRSDCMNPDCSCNSCAK